MASTKCMLVLFESRGCRGLPLPNPFGRRCDDAGCGKITHNTISKLSSYRKKLEHGQVPGNSVVWK